MSNPYDDLQSRLAALGEFRRIGDDLRRSLHEAVEQPREKAREIASETAGQAAGAERMSAPAGPASAFSRTR